MLYTTVLGLVPWKQPEMQILVPVFTEEVLSGETWSGTREAQQGREGGQAKMWVQLVL